MGKVHRWGMIVAFVVIVGCAYLGVKTVFMDDRDVSVPSVTGMPLVDALNILQTHGLLAKVDRIDAPAPVDTVVSQNISAGDKIAKGKVVLLRVSKGGAIHPIPDVRGMKFEEGVKTLSDSGFKVERVVRVTDKLAPAGTVIAQNPAAPQRVSSNSMLTLLVSSGVQGENSFVELPDLRGYGRQAAIDMLEQLGLRLGQTSDAPSDAVPTGTVLSTRPRSGTRVPTGSLVGLVFARTPLPGDAPTEDVPPQTEVLNAEREEEVRQLVISEAQPATIPTKIPSVEDAQRQNVTQRPVAQSDAAQSQQIRTTTQIRRETQQSQVQPEPQTTAAAAPQKEQKTARVRYQVPPLSKPLTLKIEIMDENGTRVLRDNAAKSGEYVSMNVSYVGDARVTIYLGGDFVWQESFN